MHKKNDSCFDQIDRILWAQSRVIIARFDKGQTKHHVFCETGRMITESGFGSITTNYDVCTTARYESDKTFLNT
jgi:hypothetical protein